MNGFEIAGMIVAGFVVLRCWIAGPYVTLEQKRRLQRLVIVGCPVSFVLFSIGFML